ncbi:MAG: hypothetical protein C7B45_16045 [Sulfobacillus acidophilus]|uniref:Uncharacterized protein n=1 Tax=Sulfobacillus acidophilus TaxID=53633 RepID=A0A2T2WD87_9FIRM|nr:MAG: hypothetical protein C7B45_16045 [Sulfobacillus acidophilus]
MTGLVWYATAQVERYAPSPPSANLAPHPNFNRVCAVIGEASSACTAATVSALDQARRDEGIGPLYLPRTWSKLTPAEQLFVIVNLERTARGEVPITGLTAGLDNVAAAGARSQQDPLVGMPAAPVVSVWARTPGPLASDYDWMYDDGFGGVGRTLNVDCTSAMAPGCWEHRANILAEWRTRLLAGIPGTWYLAAGAAQVTVSVGLPFSGPREESDALLVTAYPSPPTYVYTWRQALAAGAGNPRRGWSPVAPSWLKWVRIGLDADRVPLVMTAVLVAGLSVWTLKRLPLRTVSARSRSRWP